MRRRHNDDKQLQTQPARAHGEEGLRAHATNSDAAASPSASSRLKAASGSRDGVVATVVPIALAAFMLGVYVTTLYPSVAGGDSGELVAESCHLGVSHPPGYPLFNMAVHVFVLLLPWDVIGSTTTIAWRANLFSAVCDTAAAVLIYHCVLHWTSRQNGRYARHVPAVTAAALFAFSPLIWTYAVGAEVFALNNLFAALLLYTLLHYAHGGRSLRSALAGAFVSGLALCNQHTIVLFELPIVAWVLFTRRHSLLRENELLKLSAAFLAGLLPYIYMPITMSLNPQPGSWGDVTTLAGWFHHVRRGDYGTFRLFSTHEAHEDLWTRLGLYALNLSTREIPLHLAAPVLALGVLTSLLRRGQQPSAPVQRTSMLPATRTRRTGACSPATSAAFSSSDAVDPAVSWLLLATYAVYMLVFHSLANLPLSEGLTYGVHMRFWQQPNVLVFIWLGIGLGELLRLAERVTEHLALYITSTSSSADTARHVAMMLASTLCLALVGVQIATWHSLCDQRRAFYIRDYARALLDPLPPHAVLVVNFDLQWTALRYLQRCEQRRADVTVLNLSMMSFQWFASKHAHYPTLVFPGSRLVPFGGASDGFTFASFLDANYEPLSSSEPHQQQHTRRGIFFGGKLNYQDADLHAKYTFTPFGLLDEIHRKDEAATAPQLQLWPWYTEQQRVMQLVRARLPVLPPSELYNDETWEWTIARDYGMKTLSWSTFLLERTVAEDPLNVALLSEATHAMERAYQFEPRQFWSPVATLKNLGLAYAQIVKSSDDFVRDPFMNDVVGASVGDKARYKDRASARMLEVWDAWLRLPDARRDPGFAAIESVVRKFVPASQPATSTAQPTTPAQTTPKQKAKKKKKTKRRSGSKTHKPAAAT